MNAFVSISKTGGWLAALALAALVAGCGSCGSNSSGEDHGPAGAAPKLGAAASFGAFGGSAGITSCGATKINGDAGTTAAATLVTGFKDEDGTGDTYSDAGCPGIVTGTIYTDVPPPGTVAKKVKADKVALDTNTAYLAT